MHNKFSTFTLKPIEDSDIPLVKKWMQQDYIAKWYHRPEEWIKEIQQREGHFNFLHHYIVYDAGHPFAFCQYYDYFYAQEEWYSVDSKGHSYSIDYLIGDPIYLGKGCGKAIIKALVEKIKSNKSAKRIVVKPENENIASGKSLQTNGFLFDKKNQYYYMDLYTLYDYYLF